MNPMPQRVDHASIPKHPKRLPSLSRFASFARLLRGTVHAAALLTLSTAPSASAYLDLPRPANDRPVRLLEAPSPRIQLANSWRPNPYSVEPTRDSPTLLQGDTIPSVGQLFERFFDSLQLSVPDNSSVGVTSEKTLQGIPGIITSVQVQLNLTGRDSQPMFNGDFHITLSHLSGFAVLINRPGRREGFSAGYGDSGFEIRLSDTAAADIHNYRVTATGSHTTPLSLGDVPAPLTGTWQPDGRSIDPSQVLPGSPRDAMLGSFVGLDPNGTWTLQVTDLSENGLGELVSWSLHITTVPELHHGALAIAACLVLFAGFHGSRRRALP